MLKNQEINSNIQFDVIIVGGGLAGLTCALHLSMQNISVLIIEKNSYPKHKVCGEYVSNEVLPYLRYLDINPIALGAKKIKQFELSTHNNNLVSARLPLGGFSISRYKFDYALAEKAKSKGVKIIHDEVSNIEFLNDEFQVATKKMTQLQSKIVIGAYGKRSAIDTKLNRGFIKKKSPFLAVKTHAKGNFPSDVVALHNFKGGYCGVSKVEDESLNLCYIVNYDSFKKYKDIDEFQKQVVFKNTYLKDIFDRSAPVFKTRLTISQISFSVKSPIEQHILMCGDTAGMIHPLCGNGMSMAIRSAQILSELIVRYYRKKIKSREELEKAYLTSWNKEFKSRLKAGRIIASLFNQEKLAEVMMWLVKLFPSLLPKIIQLTHGKPMLAK